MKNFPKIIILRQLPKSTRRRPTSTRYVDLFTVVAVHDVHSPMSSKHIYVTQPAKPEPEKKKKKKKKDEKDDSWYDHLNFFDSESEAEYEER